MKPVIVQTLMRSMKKKVTLPAPPTTDVQPVRKDRAGTFMLVIGLLVIVALILM